MITPTRDIEATLQAEGYHLVAGVDEVGRGCLAGPVVAAAVLLPERIDIPLLRDSKKLSARQRAVVVPQIKQQAKDCALGWVSAAEVDAHGLSWAVQQSGLRALAGLRMPPDVTILDGSHNYLAGTPYTSRAYVAADATEACVAAASILAKEARDAYMQQLAHVYPQYGFEKHVGYGTAVHRAALAEYGASPVHRRSFAGVG